MSRQPKKKEDKQEFSVKYQMILRLSMLIIVNINGCLKMKKKKLLKKTLVIKAQVLKIDIKIMKKFGKTNPNKTLHLVMN